MRRFDLPAELGLVLVVPPERLATRHARAVLPSEVSRADAVWNVQHAALLIAALACGRLEDVPLALRDRLHEDARAGLAPTFAALRGRAAKLGALGVTLSGAGPSVLVWCRRAEAEAVAARVRALVPHALRVEALEPDAAGVCVETGLAGGRTVRSPGRVDRQEVERVLARDHRAHRVLDLDARRVVLVGEGRDRLDEREALAADALEEHAEERLAVERRRVVGGRAPWRSPRRARARRGARRRAQRAGASSPGRPGA